MNASTILKKRKMSIERMKKVKFPKPPKKQNKTKTKTKKSTKRDKIKQKIETEVNTIIH